MPPDVLYVAYDSETHGVQAQIAHSRGLLGMALVLTGAPGATGLALTSLAERPAPEHSAGSANAMADGLLLLAALERGGNEQLFLPLGPDSMLQVQVRHG